MTVGTEMHAPTAIHRQVNELRAGSSSRLIGQMASGWAIMGATRIVPGYCLLLPDPVVPHLNSLDRVQRRRFLDDMAMLGDAVLTATGADRINYEMLGNLEPALHAHVLPRRVDEPAALRTRPIWFFDWDAAPPFDESRDGPLRLAIAAELYRLDALLEDDAGD